MNGFCENRIYRNGGMTLKAKAFKDSSVLFARLNGDGSIFDYCIGKGCEFDGDNVSWCWGSYLMHDDFQKALEVFGGVK